ncbi:MAG: pyruvate dehydrogenase complex dihydrolipoamide acetyltransferase [Holosporales bacterium]|jgi:pyruvate dehydrogenase E2 component (dihydrolipoamide acetyltransferase)|nr:pyruvate dehydrogenase complex dihydrolipoamide acetyltransferase [Holosporales bacterium]
MPTEVLMPALSPTMTEGNLAKWVKKEGDKIRPGDVIAEIETDKAIMEVEAVDGGILGKILVQDGTENVKVNEVIALLLDDGESADSIKAYSPAAAKLKPKQEAATSSGRESNKPSVLTSSNTVGDRVPATPLARRIAGDAGLDLGLVEGTGPRGRIVRDDVMKALEGDDRSRRSIEASFPQEPTLIKLSQMRKTIAQRLTSSKQQVPHFYLSVDCEIDNLLAVRKKLNSLDESNKLTVNDFVIKAVAYALIETPEANASWSDEGIYQHRSADVSVAVAVDGGLITPIIYSAHAKGLKEISLTAKELIKKANEGKLKPEEFQGGTFTVSNLGMYGVKNFNAIINPPQGCILAVGAGQQRAVVHGGSLAVATVMTCTLSVDHRVVDGVAGAKFMAAFKRCIEEPAVMLM